MPVFDEKSRYAKYAKTYETVDGRGRTVMAVGPAIPSDRPSLGDHLLQEQQRLDHLAFHYLNDPFGFWKIAECNGALLPDAVTRSRSVRIPRDQ